MDRRYTTHPNFKSLVPSIHYIDDLTKLDYIRYVLQYQYLFDRWITPQELKDWDTRDIQNFVIDMNMVDRLYYVSGCGWYDTHNCKCHLLIRICSERNTFFYVEVACCACTCDGHCGGGEDGDGGNGDSGGGGIITISRDARLFMNLVLSFDHDKNQIYQSLIEDGIYIADIYDDYDGYYSDIDQQYRDRYSSTYHQLISLMNASSSPLDKYFVLPLHVISLRTVYNNKDILLDKIISGENFPLTLGNRIKKYIGDRDAKMMYESYIHNHIIYKPFMKWRYVRNFIATFEGAQSV